MTQHLKLKGNQRKILKDILKTLVFKKKIFKVVKNVYKGSLEPGENLRIKSDKGRMQVIGRLQMHHDGYGFVLQPESSDVFIAATNIRDALPDDEVLAEVFLNKKNGKREGAVLEVKSRGRLEWTGCVHKIGGDYYAINREFRAEYTIRLLDFETSGAKVNDVVIVRVTSYPTGSHGWIQGHVISVLGPEGSEATEVNLVLAKHKIPRSFPSEVVKEAKSLKSYVYQAGSSRVDLRSKPFLTIDGADAKDFDDAILVEEINGRYHLYVSIADVSYYVRPGSKLDEEAYERGTSTYFPRFCVPMLPEELSNDLCSLKENVDRPTQTCELVYDKKGQLLDVYYYASVIRSVKRAIYEDIQKIIQGEVVSGYERIPDLSICYKLYQILYKQRKSRGALDFDLPEAYFLFDQKGNISEVKKRLRLDAHMLIEEFMIAANQAVAFLFQTYHVPSLYRIHENPDPVKMSELRTLMHNLGVDVAFGDTPTPLELAKVLHEIQKHPSVEVINQNLLRSLRVAVYSPENKGHFGLALKYYCHFTSPIRRYPDLIVHRTLSFLLSQVKDNCLKLNVNGYKNKLAAKQVKVSGALYTQKKLAEIGNATSASERKSMEAEREMQSLMLCLYIKKFEGNVFMGTIRRIAKFGVFVELTPHFAEGLVPTSELGLDFCRLDEKHMKIVGKVAGRHVSFSLGDKINVMVSYVDISRRQIQLEREEQRPLKENKTYRKKRRK